MPECFLCLDQDCQKSTWGFPPNYAFHQPYNLRIWIAGDNCYLEEWLETDFQWKHWLVRRRLYFWLFGENVPILAVRVPNIRFPHYVHVPEYSNVGRSTPQAWRRLSSLLIDESRKSRSGRAGECSNHSHFFNRCGVSFRWIILVPRLACFFLKALSNSAITKGLFFQNCQWKTLMNSVS